MNPFELLQELVSIPGPPGQEDLVRAALQAHLDTMGYKQETDAKGNLIVRLGKGKSKVVVTAHMDEIALYVKQVLPDGTLKVEALGGLLPWKLGEGPVTILPSTGPIEAVLGFGSIHTDSNYSPTKRARTEALTWEAATVIAAITKEEMTGRGVRPGTRVAVSPTRRTLTKMGNFVAGYFLDDRADLVSWLLALDQLKGQELDVTFVATTSEEVGGEGALFFLAHELPDICIALELGPNVVDAPIRTDENPTVWVSDSYASMPPFLGDVLERASAEVGLPLQYQALSRGGSDASCAASRGMCAHPITLGLPMSNTHGYEIIHKDSMANLAKLTAALVKML